MEAQEIINYLVMLAGGVLGFLLRTVWQAVKDLQDADKKITEKVGELEVVVAGMYMRKDEFTHFSNVFFAKLDKMSDKIDHLSDKLDKKADK